MAIRCPTGCSVRFSAALRSVHPRARAAGGNVVRIAAGVLQPIVLNLTRAQRLDVRRGNRRLRLGLKLRDATGVHRGVAVIKLA
jgi:hypothetical protein